MVPATVGCARTRTRVRPLALIVEDDRRAQRFLRQILADLGFDVVSAETVAEGLDRLDDDLACVLLDLHLPDGAGESVLEVIRAEGRPVPVVVMTAESDPARLERVAALQPDLFLPKPIDLATLCEWLELVATRPEVVPEWGVVAV